MIIVNGIEYEKIEIERGRQSGKTLSKLLMMSAAFQYFDPRVGSPRNAKQPPVSDIVKEFELIQLKQSKLSRADRDLVVSIFNRNYKPKTILK